MSRRVGKMSDDLHPSELFDTNVESTFETKLSFDLQFIFVLETFWAAFGNKFQNGFVTEQVFRHFYLKSYL